MGIFKSYFSKNNTLIEGNYTNNSQNPVTEISYGTSNPQVSRFILDVDLESLKERINSGIINPNKIVSHKLVMTNTIRYDKEYLNRYMSDGITHRASSFDLEVFTLDEEWDEGSGYEFLYYPEAYILAPTGASNWYFRTTDSQWQTAGVYNTGSTSILGYLHFDKGNENIEFDVTEYVNARIGLPVSSGFTGMTGSTGIGIKFKSEFEVLETLYREAVAFFAKDTHTFYEPFIETIYDDLITDDRNNFFLDKDNSLYLYANVGANPNAITVNSVEIIDYQGNTISTITGSSIENVTLGVYKITLNIDSDVYPDAVLFTDRWNITQNSKNKVIDQEFYLISQFNYFNFENSNRINFDNYMFSFYGLFQGEKVKDSNIRRIEIDVKQLYPNQNNNIPLDIEYRLYNSQTDRHQSDVISWTKVNRTNRGYEILLDFSWLVPQDYTLECRLVNGNFYEIKENIKFTVISEAITTPANASAVVVPYIPPVPTTTTTTTTTTTLAPNPKIFMSLTPVLTTGYTNTNNLVLTGQRYKLYWTTDSNNTQITGSTGQTLIYAKQIKLNWTSIIPNTCSFDSISTYNIIGMPINVDILGDYTVILNAGINEGYIIFDIYDESPLEDNSYFEISASNVLDPTQLFGTPTDSSDPEFELRTVAGTAYGYDVLNSSLNKMFGHVIQL